MTTDPCRLVRQVNKLGSQPSVQTHRRPQAPTCVGVETLAWRVNKSPYKGSSTQRLLNQNH